MSSEKLARLTVQVEFDGFGPRPIELLISAATAPFNEYEFESRLSIAGARLIGNALLLCAQEAESQAKELPTYPRGVIPDRVDISGAVTMEVVNAYISRDGEPVKVTDLD